MCLGIAFLSESTLGTKLMSVYLGQSLGHLCLSHFFLVASLLDSFLGHFLKDTETTLGEIASVSKRHAMVQLGHEGDWQLVLFFQGTCSL